VLTEDTEAAIRRVVMELLQLERGSDAATAVAAVEVQPPSTSRPRTTTATLTRQGVGGSAGGNRTQFAPVVLRREDISLPTRPRVASPAKSSAPTAGSRSRGGTPSRSGGTPSRVASVDTARASARPPAPGRRNALEAFLDEMLTNGGDSADASAPHTTSAARVTDAAARPLQRSRSAAAPTEAAVPVVTSVSVAARRSTDAAGSDSDASSSLEDLSHLTVSVVDGGSSSVPRASSSRGVQSAPAAPWSGTAKLRRFGKR
jgi:hypothetical protein